MKIEKNEMRKIIIIKNLRKLKNVTLMGIVGLCVWSAMDSIGFAIIYSKGAEILIEKIMIGWGEWVIIPALLMGLGLLAIKITVVIVVLKTLGLLEFMEKGEEE